jgi:Pheromone A receptor
MQHPELPLFAFSTAILVVIPIPWHWRARNVATLAIIAWLFAVDVIFGVNSLVWAGNVNNLIPVWCDISVFFLDSSRPITDVV